MSKLAKRITEHRTRVRGARRKGNVVVFTALGLVTLLGFCAFAGDYGLLVWNKNQLQKACDAAALAGAMELPLYPAKADEAARATAQQNALNSPAISYPNNRRIRVSGSRVVKFFFAGALGQKSGTVTATALAGRSYPLVGVTNAVPIAIPETTYFTYRPGTGLASAGASFTLSLSRNTKDAFTIINFLPLDLRPDNSGKSGSVFQDDVAYGYDGTIYLNTQINNGLAASGSSVGPNVEQAMATRFGDARNAPYRDFGPRGTSTNPNGQGNSYEYPNYPPDDRRIMTVVVTPEYPANNNNPSVLIKFFVAVYVEDCWIDKKSQDCMLQLRILPERTYSSSDPGIVVGDATTPDTGLSVVQLLE